jgi:hypothetical protein
MNQTFLRKMRQPLPLFLGVLVLLVGSIEGWYGRLEYSGDDISYLSVTKMIHLNDWKAALNPLWSIGYPLLLSFFHLFFPTTLRGELMAIFTLNIVICFLSWLSFLWLLHTIVQFTRNNLSDTLPDSLPNSRQTSLPPFLLITGTCVFLAAQLGLGNVSIVGPDQLIAGLFFLAVGIMLHLFQRPTIETGLLFGAILGIGFFVKAIFLALSVILLITTVLYSRKQIKAAPLAAAIATFLILVAIYGTALSWAYGQPTLGESGSLNYAFHVNHLPHWMGWEGGPPQLGNPIHPVRQIFDNPAVFAFGEPFHVTYPPQYALVYWYQGYRHFFDIRNVVTAFLLNVRYLITLLRDNDRVVLAILLCACVAFFLQKNRGAWLRQFIHAWPWILPPVLGLVLYLQVHLEARYVSGFIAVLGIVPFIAMELWGTGVPTKLKALITVILIAGTALTLYPLLHDPSRLAVHGSDITSGDSWKIARYLQQIGMHEGDKVAEVSNRNDIRCTWAYASGVHIVAGIGNDIHDPKERMQDTHLFFDDPHIQQQVLNLFRQQGAIVVVAPYMPYDVVSPGWQHVPGTAAWVLKL